MPPSTCDGQLTGQLVETAHLKKMLPELKRACAKMPFLLCGPPGCGKKCALRLALGETKLSLHDIAMISNERGTKLDSLKELVRTHGFGQQMLTGEGEAEPSVVVLYGAEHLGCDCVEYLWGQRGRLNVVLIASDRGKELTRFPIVWVKRPNFGEVVDFLRLLLPRLGVPDAQAAARISDGDLRQAKLQVDFWHVGSTARDCTSNKERAPHAYFDAQDALCNGRRGELTYGTACWAQRNRLRVEETVEKHADFAATMATWDVFGGIERGSQECPDTLCSRPEIAGLAVQQLVGKKRRRFDLERPQDTPCPLHNWYDGSTGKRRKGTQRFDDDRLRRLAARLGSPERSARTASACAASPLSDSGGVSTTAPVFLPSGCEITEGSTRRVKPQPAPCMAVRADAPVPCDSASGDGAAPSRADFTGTLVYDGKPEFEIHAADVSREEGSRPQFCPGPACRHFAKSRVVFFAKCCGLEDFKRIAQTTGVLGCIVAQFEGGTYALVFKERNREFKACQECFCLCEGRVSHAVVGAACALFTSCKHVRNIEVHKKGPDDGEEMPDFEDACELLGEISSGAFNALHANALKARKYKRCTPLQEGILTYTPDLKDWLHAREDAESMIFKTTDPGPHFLNDFKRDTVLGLKGVHFEREGGIQMTTLREAISAPQSATKPPLYLTKTLIFVGRAGDGKSEIMHGLSREFCQRKGKTCYGFSASIDPYGLMTKSGKIKELGCVSLYDFSLTSRLDQLLGREESKGLLYTKERAHVPARYHQAIFYEWVPRMWSVNYGMDESGGVDKAEWFSSQGLPALAALVNRDAPGIERGGEHDIATARRAVIFCVDENLYEQGAQGATDAVGLEVWRAEQASATPLD